MKRITAITLVLAALSGPLHASEMMQVAVIKSRDIAPYNLASRGFKDYLNEVGADAGITECTLKGERKHDLLKIREEVKSRKPDLVFTLGTPATRLTQEVVKDIPVVFTMVLDPEASNVLPPGVIMAIPPEVKLRNLKRLLPNAKRIGLIYSQNSISAYQKISQRCSVRGFELVSKRISSGKELAEAFKAISSRIDCFLMVPDPQIYFPKSVEYLLRQGLQKKVPVIGLSSFYTKAGALMSFDCDYKYLGRQAAEISSQILSGVKPADLKSVGPQKIKFSLNLLVAERLGIRVPSEMIEEASEVFGR